MVRKSSQVSIACQFRRRDETDAASSEPGPGPARSPAGRVQAASASSMQMTVARKIIELDSGRITMLNTTRQQHKGFGTGAKASGAQKKAPDVDDRKAISPGEYLN